MKKYIRLAILGLFACVCLAACSDDEPAGSSDENKQENTGGGNSGNSGGSGGTTTTPNYSLTASNHPRVVYTQDDFDAIKEMVADGSNTYLTQIHNVIISLADSYLGGSGVERKDSGKRISNYGTACAHVICLAYAYKTTGDSKYLEQAEIDIKAVCSWTDWNSSKHTLSAGELAGAVGLAYDWLYNDLSSSAKSSALKGITDFAFTPISNKDYSENFYEVDNNWNSVCNGGLVCAALATYESDQTVAQKFIDDAIAANPLYMEASYSPDGNYPEGYGYWCYGTIYEVLMLTALETATGSDSNLSSSDGFSKTGQYPIYMEGPVNKCFNYSDCTESVRPCLAEWYFAWKFKDYSVLYSEVGKIAGSYKSGSYYYLLPVIAWYASKIDASSIAAPTQNIYHGDGLTPVVLIHDTWTMDSNDKFLGIVAGNGKANHAHLDAGSFVYDADGYRWASDLGQDDYTTLEANMSGVFDMSDGSNRWTKVFRYNNFNHNTLTINDAYHLSAGFADITEVIDDGTKRGAVIDITAPLKDEVSSAVRTIYMEGDDLVIEDKIVAKSSKAASVKWTLVTPATVDANYYGCVSLKQGKVNRYLSYTSSTGHKVTWTTWSTQSEYSWNGSNAGYYECGYTTTINAGNTAIITVRLSPDDPVEE